MPVAGEGPPVTDLLVLATDPDPWVHSVARQARGIVYRDRGLLDVAVPELRRAVRLAEDSGDPDRCADVRATLGVALTMAGRTKSGLEQLRRAADSASDPTVRAKILMRRGHVLY